jgi:predicted Zn-dependent protease
MGFGSPRRLLTLGLFVCLLGLSTCASLDPDHNDTVSEVRPEIERDLSLKLERIIESRDSQVQPMAIADPEVERFLQDLHVRLAQGSPVITKLMKGRPSEIRLIAPLNSRYRSLATPLGKLFLSRDLVRSMEFENELAALVAIELSHLHFRHLLNRYERFSKLRGESASWPPTLVNRLLVCTDDENAEAARLAVQFLYNSGYDPRGVPAFLERVARDSAHSPYSPRAVALMVARAREEIVLFTPLPKPIIRSNAFVRVEGKLKRL